MRVMLAVLCCTGFVPVATSAQQPVPACARSSGTSVPDSTAPIPAEPHLTGPNSMQEMRPADASTTPVRLRFLVATNGRIPPYTISVTGTSDRRWLVFARRWLLRMRFAPMMDGDCAVPQWMTLTYDYAGTEPQDR